MLDWSKSFIEEQFPVAKISKESYTERKAVQSQTLTGLGKWWGRKPLILVRAVLFGALMPVSDDKQKDKEIFLKILTMDDAGIKKRFNCKYPNIPYTSREDATYEEKTYNHVEIVEDRKGNLVDKVCPCCRPENIDGPDEESWVAINNHLGTDAHSLQELSQQLGMKRYGHVPRVGDCFAGGGSNVFEPARMGCDVYGSDLNPLAGILTWADLNILSLTDEEMSSLYEFQNNVIENVNAILSDLDVECRDGQFVAKSYLYCNETVCPECGCKVPLLPSLIVSHRDKLVVDINVNGNFCDLKLKKVIDLKSADKYATIKNNNLVCPCCHKTTSLLSIRGGKDIKKLRLWNSSDFAANETDLFSERLYAIKFVSTEPKNKDYFFRVPNADDLKREKTIYNYVKDNFVNWQEKGYIASTEIYEGDKTSELIRTRGWKYWHQLYNPRQLLINALLMKSLFDYSTTKLELCASILIMNKVLDWNSKLCRWGTGQARESIAQTFYNQALNTIWNYGVRSFDLLRNAIEISLRARYKKLSSNQSIKLIDAKDVNDICDIWITDPPYADAVNYHELSEYFLAWDKTLIKQAFPDWYTDSKRILAIKGTGETFNKSMVEVYRNLAEHMPENGMQIVMFTHQDTKVWAELSMILWSAGLQVTSAWCIATETESGGLKQGNYVKGTVLMVLRKRVTDEEAFEDELYEEIRDEVKYQIDSMHELDDVANPDFTDGDYLLAAYVAALKVITSYASIEGLDVEYELNKARESNTESPVTKIINQARKEAYDYLVPEGVSSMTWSKFTNEERFYIKGLAMELNGIHTLGAFQELARGFAVADYTSMMGSVKSNAVRLKLPKEYKMNQITEDGFGSSVVRQVLAAVYISSCKENVQEGVSYLRSHYLDNNEYWTLRNKIIAILDFLTKVKGNQNVDYWQDDAEYVVMLRDAVRNDSL